METQNKARAQALAKPHSLTSSGPEKDVSSLTEICNECGRSVARGSGRFVNRIQDLDTVETRKENGKPYPEGDFICAECDERARAPSLRLNPRLSVDAKETIRVSVHGVPIETMITLEKQFNAKAEFRTEDDDPTESYSVLEVDVANLNLTFFSIHLHKELK